MSSAKCARFATLVAVTSVIVTAGLATVVPDKARAADVDPRPCPDGMTLDPETVCLYAVIGTTSADQPVSGTVELDNKVAAEAVRQTVLNGETETADLFVTQAAAQYPADVVDTMRATIANAEHAPEVDTLEVGTTEDSGSVNPADFGSPKYRTRYPRYVVVMSSGSTRTISKTKAEFNMYINRDPDDYGVKAISVHYTKNSGRNTYYSAGECKIRHSSPFFDSDVMTWGKCENPDYNAVNHRNVYIYERDYYGTRGETYYTKHWIQINPDGAQYPKRGYDYSGPRWRNPDSGGPPRWK